jgi:acyl-CoA thioester hydrolase
MLEVWRGAVNAWECDDYGHLNMRFYFGRGAEGLAGLAGALGHPRAFTDQAAATLSITRQHVRFLDEARAGAPLYLTAGVLALGEQDVDVVQVLHHAEDHRPCAAITTRAIHATPDGRIFAWPSRTRDAAQALTTTPPDFSLARGTPSGERVEAEGAWSPALTRAALGPVLPRECDVFGELTVEAAAGRISDGMSLLYPPVGRAVGAALGVGRMGTAAVEYRLDHFARPRAGEMVEVRSRFLATAGKVMRLEHWLCDPGQGRVWAHAYSVAVHFDLDHRRAVSAPAEVIEALGLVAPAAA